MRSNAAEYALTAPRTLTEVLQTLASDPSLIPIAGGTELMVALSAGRLPQKNLLSINHLKELRFIEVTPEAITIGSSTTFTDIRRSAVIASDFPLLVQAASWTGSIANQNRGTLGGNIVNGSPAADSPPALLAYDATLTLISASRHPHAALLSNADFHLGYKRTGLRPGELLHSIRIERRFSAYRTYIRKVGTRNAQAISKVALACSGARCERRDATSKTYASAPPASARHPRAASPPSSALLNQPRITGTWKPPSPLPAPPSPPKPAPSTTSARPPNTAPRSPPTSSKNSCAASSALLKASKTDPPANNLSATLHPPPCPRPGLQPVRQVFGKRLVLAKFPRRRAACISSARGDIKGSRECGMVLMMAQRTHQPKNPSEAP